METIITSLQTREWVTSIDFKDANFHITLQCTKYLCFEIQGESYEFKALLFGLSTVSIEFRAMMKQFKLMAIHKDIRIHKHLGDWLIRNRYNKACLQLKQVALCQVKNISTQVDSIWG